MKLYHGSHYDVKNPIANRGRESTDFGRGFYVTTNFEQAKKWAINKKRSAGENAQAIVTVYEVDDDLLDKDKYNIKQFSSPNREWLSFVVNCRRAILHEYDIVLGAVANDRVYATITLFESGVLTAETTVAQLRVDDLFDQISFHTPQAIEELRYIGASIV